MKKGNLKKITLTKETIRGLTNSHAEPRAIPDSHNTGCCTTVA